jgi:hypothetical protein
MPRRFRVGVVGSRRRNSSRDRALVHSELTKLWHEHAPNLVVVSGGCKKGADRFAKEFALAEGLEYAEYLPDLTAVKTRYDAIGRYYARNKLIADNCDMLIALVSEDRRGGTENTIAHARKRTIPIHIWEVQQ